MGEGDEADEDERKREEAKAAEGGGAELREGLGARAQRVDGGVDRLEVVGETARTPSSASR